MQILMEVRPVVSPSNPGQTDRQTNKQTNKQTGLLYLYGKLNYCGGLFINSQYLVTK